MTEFNSEQELLKMKQEGKLTEAEYSELLSEIRKNPQEGAKSEKISESDSKRKMGIISLVLAIAGIFLPLLFYSILLALTSGSNFRPGIAPWFFLGMALEVAALVLGIISWRTEYGKAGTIISALVLVFSILFI